MPNMFRPGGVTRMFRSREEGLKAGFYPTFNDMAKAQKAKNKGVEAAPTPPPNEEAPAAPTPEKAEVRVENAPTPPAPVLDDDNDDMVIPVHDDLPPPPSARRPCPDMELGEVKKLAEEFGLDTTVHHMTLRAQVEEKLNAESGSD